MVVDSSAIIAVLFREPEALGIARALSKTPLRRISPVNALETSMVMEARKGERGGEELDVFFARSEIEIFPMNTEQWEIARSAWRSFGKGWHPAGLNMGDCCAYALAKYLDEPILFKGNDSGKTDLKSVIY